MPGLRSAVRRGAAAACLVAVLGCAPSGPELQVRDQRTGDVHLRLPAHDGQLIEMSWTHSIEHTRWVEVWELHDDHLRLRETLLEGYGAGVPSEGEARVEDGIIHVTGIDRTVEQLAWVHSHDVGHTLRVDGEVVVAPGDLPHHALVELLVSGHTAGTDHGRSTS